MQKINRSIRTAVGLVGLLLLCMTVGCSQMTPDRAARMNRGYVYYLDGAGGGGWLINWRGGVRQGLVDAGYDGSGEMFRWQTGWGVIADQDSSVTYKRRKGSNLADKIQKYKQDHPGAPVTIMALSAGTAVAVFALEALPADQPIDTVVLLGASISADFDLTQALQRIRGRMYVYTSEHDAVLAYLVPASGTADRQRSVDAAGLHGFQMPLSTATETRALYAKISYIPWRPEFAEAGNMGRHTDVVKDLFVQQYVAPLIMRSGAHSIPRTTAAGMVPNPDYQRWNRFPAGSWAAFEGYQIENGRKQRIRMKATLVSRHKDRIVVERIYAYLNGDHRVYAPAQTFMPASTIAPKDHPLTSPTAKITKLPDEQIAAAGQFFDCQSRTILAAGHFPEWGSNVGCRLLTNSAVPGGVVRVTLRAYRDAQRFEYEGQLIGYGIPK